MFKKLLSLSAAAMVCASLYAAPGDVVEDYYIDWKYSNWNFYVMGYEPQTIDGIVTSENPLDENGEPAWYQYFVADGIPTAPGTTYKVTAKIKASEEVTFNLNMGWGWGDGEQIGRQITATTEWSEQEIEYPEVGGSSCNLVAQPGTSLAKIEWEWIRVTHIDNAKPVEWINVLINGDAEGDDNSCFWTKLYGVDLMNSEIETVDGSRVYAIHAGAKQADAWDHQFFITVPEEYALQTGSDVKISFRYKASQAAKASTQIHSTATNYMHWQAIGDINFTTDWQNFSKTLTPSSEMNNGRTIAFNLNEFEGANDYYFDDIQWCITPTEDGWFVAGDFLDDPWNYDNAYVMEITEDETFATIVGTEEKPASVVRISTKRGNDNAFNSNCIKCAEVVNEEWLDYTTAGAYKINLPEEGIWSIEVDPEYNQICFTNITLGISSIENDANAPAVYYNMQGMQIANPVNGQLYIVKKGNKVSKIIR